MRVEELEAELGAFAVVGPVDYQLGSSTPATLHDVVHDSRKATPASLFCAVAGLTVDGHDYIPAAVANGATAVLVERFVDVDCAQLKVTRVRQAMAHAAAIVHEHPSDDLAVVGITGTNGKTTTTQLFADILRHAGQVCDVIGTLGGVHTTPESTELQRQLRRLANEGTDVVALEVSSHALDQHRVDATQFAVAAFSNLTPDHLDYHGDMDSYFEAKSKLFDGRAAHEVINVDDPWGQRLAAVRSNAHQLSLADIDIRQETLGGTHFTWRDLDAFVPLPGRMNVANALMAVEAAVLVGVSEQDAVAGLSSSGLVPGRMELVSPISADRPTVIVDYSHTPDSIERAIATLRRSMDGKSALSIVFGCGGDRDRAKRPLMAAAAEAADHVFLTSDNPRTEDPMAIINAAAAGLSVPSRATIEPDRRKAIEAAIIVARPGDVVLIAGKGHEKTQTIGTDVLPFDDVTVAREILQADSA